MRHIQLNEYLGVLDMEKKSFDRAQLFSWLFFPIWIVMSILQSVCFILANGKFHPLAVILKTSNKADQGRIFSLFLPITFAVTEIEMSSVSFL